MAKTKVYNTVSSLIIDKGTQPTSTLDSVIDATPTIKITDPTPSGTHALTLNNTNLSLNPNFPGTIVDSPDGPKGSVLKTGGAQQTFSGHNTYTGGTFVNGGTLQLTIEDWLSTGPVTLGGGTLEIGGHTEHVGNVTLNSEAITGATGATLIGTSMSLSAGSISVPISITGAITKVTSGTVTDTAAYECNDPQRQRRHSRRTGRHPGTHRPSCGRPIEGCGTLSGGSSAVRAQP